jgi:hypothetical protein
MKTTYAVTWQEPDGHVYSGKLEVRPTSIGLEGANGEGAKAKIVPFEELIGIHIGRSTGDRLEGRPSLVLDLQRGSVKIASVAQPGILSEIAEQIASFTRGRQATLAIVVPIKPEAREQAGRLLAEGPPFDPEELGLHRHRIFLTDREAIFVFDTGERPALERLATDESVVAAAAAWHELVDGPPRLGEVVYSWNRPKDDGLVFEPTPGPGDSDGGDLFAPE